MTDLIDLSYKTVDSIRARHADSEFPYACQTGSLQALVTRLAIEVDVIGDDTLKTRIAQILLDYQSR